MSFHFPVFGLHGLEDSTGESSASLLEDAAKRRFGMTGNFRAHARARSFALASVRELAQTCGLHESRSRFHGPREYVANNEVS
jgi:hypothetical protein